MLAVQRKTPLAVMPIKMYETVPEHSSKVYAQMNERFALPFVDFSDEQTVSSYQSVSVNSLLTKPSSPAAPAGDLSSLVKSQLGSPNHVQQAHSIFRNELAQQSKPVALHVPAAVDGIIIPGEQKAKMAAMSSASRSSSESLLDLSGNATKRHIESPARATEESDIEVSRTQAKERSDVNVPRTPLTKQDQVEALYLRESQQTQFVLPACRFAEQSEVPTPLSVLSRIDTDSPTLLEVTPTEVKPYKRHQPSHIASFSKPSVTLIAAFL